MDDMTYEQCPLCRGSGVMNGSLCVCAQRLDPSPGYLPTGVTVRQLEVYADWSFALAGDPGMPEDRRRSILLKLQSRVSRALERINTDAGSPVG